MRHICDEMRHFGGAPSVAASVDAQLLQFVAQRAEGDAQLRGGAGLVVAVVGQRLLDRLAFDFLDEAGQGASGGLTGVDAGRIERGKSCR